MTINYDNDFATVVMNKLASDDKVVKDVFNRIRAIETLIDALKSNPNGISTTELEKKVYSILNPFDAPHVQSILEWFQQYGWVKREVRQEEIIEVEYDEYIDSTDRIKYNEDNTLTITPYFTKPKTIYNYNVNFHIGFNMYNVTGKYKVQVRRAYWIWKA